MLLVQERIIGNLDRVQDVLMLGMVSRAALSAVQQARWAGVHRLRLAAVPLEGYSLWHIQKWQAAFDVQGLSQSVGALRLRMRTLTVPEFLSARRLSHAAPSPANAAWIASRCTNLRELDATGCARLTVESLLPLAHIPFEVSSCRQYSSCHGYTEPVAGAHGFAACGQYL